MRPAYRRFRALIACCIVLSAFVTLPWISPHPVAAGTAYTIIDLGTLRPDNSGRSDATGINFSGQIVGGAAFGPEAGGHAFIREPSGEMHDLGTLSSQNHVFSLARANNAGGTVVGDSSDGLAHTHATIWQRDEGGAFVARDLGSLTGNDFSRSFAQDINDLGWVVGSGDAPRSSSHGALWQIAKDGTITLIELGTLLDDNEGVSFAQAINNAGYIVGSAASFHGYTATRWETDPSGNVTILDLGTATGNGVSAAFDINEAGLIVGERTAQGSIGAQAALWRVAGENEISHVHLPPLLNGSFAGSRAQAINNHDLIVGWSAAKLRPADLEDASHAVIWRVGPGDTASVMDLNSLIPSTLGWELVTAYDINDAGQIVGTGRRNGEHRAFLLNPVEGNILAISTHHALTDTIGVPELGAIAVGPTPAPGPYATGTVVTLTAQPQPNAIFTGWVVDGIFRGWASTLTLTMDGDHAVEVFFGLRETFVDLPPNEPAREAIEQLAARGIVLGYGYVGCPQIPPYRCYGPGDPVRRAQAAVMLVRALGWEGESQGDLPFTDLGNTDEEMKRAIRILAAKGVVEGYGDGRFGPDDEVSRAQVISIIARALVEGGYWQPVTVDDPSIYPNIPANSPHRLDILTYVAQAGEVPYDPPAGDWPEWLLGGSRAWTADALWRALDSTFGP